jgi:hypothetical protein
VLHLHAGKNPIKPVNKYENVATGSCKNTIHLVLIGPLLILVHAESFLFCCLFSVAIPSDYGAVIYFKSQDMSS